MDGDLKPCRSVNSVWCKWQDRDLLSSKQPESFLSLPAQIATSTSVVRGLDHSGRVTPTNMRPLTCQMQCLLPRLPCTCRYSSVHQSQHPMSRLQASTTPVIDAPPLGHSVIDCTTSCPTIVFNSSITPHPISKLYPTSNQTHIEDAKRLRKISSVLVGLQVGLHQLKCLSGLVWCERAGCSGLLAWAHELAHNVERTLLVAAARLFDHGPAAFVAYFGFGLGLGYWRPRLLISSSIFL